MGSRKVLSSLELVSGTLQIELASSIMASARDSTVNRGAMLQFGRFRNRFQIRSMDFY
jgi:hypothetical protein